MKKDPEGYKKLLVYKRADELHWEVLKLSEEIERVEKEKRDVKGNVDKILLELAHQLGRAARSPLSNIAEGWKRNTTTEYHTFLGYSIASNDEIKRDAEDIIRGKYQKLKGEMGIMGEMGRGQKNVPFAPLTPFNPFTIDDVVKLPFYPLDPLLPFVVQIYLRCKELDYLLHQLQQSLEKKMQQEGTMPMRQKLKSRKQEQDEADSWLKDQIKNNQP
jgi:four helix bundle protein